MPRCRPMCVLLMTASNSICERSEPGGGRSRAGVIPGAPCFYAAQALALRAGAARNLPLHCSLDSGV